MSMRVRARVFVFFGRDTMGKDGLAGAGVLDDEVGGDSCVSRFFWIFWVPPLLWCVWKLVLYIRWYYEDSNDDDMDIVV
jgi:hypothetical protein